MNTAIRTVVGIVVLTLLPLDAQARTFKVKAGESIQTAINAAGDNDTIKIATGVFQETIVVPHFKDGLTIKGGKGTILDARPDAPNGSGTGITIFGDGTIVSGLTIRHTSSGGGAHPDSDSSGHGIYVDAEDVRIDKVTILNSLGEGIVLRGSDHEVTKCTIIGVGTGVVVEADDCEIAGTTIQGARGFGIYASTFEVEITKCRIERCQSDGIRADVAEAVIHDNEIEVVQEGISVNASGARVTSNEVSDSAGWGISVSAQGPVVVDNCVDGSFSGGIYVNGQAALVNNNDVANVRASSPGIQVDSSNATVEGNTVENIAWYGMAVFGFMNRIAKNRVESCGSYGSASIYVGGDEMTVDGNTVGDSQGAGIRISGGFGITVSKNKVSDGLYTGIVLNSTSEALLDGNKVQKNLGEGIQNFGSQTSLRGNTSTGNRTDFTNDGSIVDLGGNKFGKGAEAPASAGQPELY